MVDRIFRRPVKRWLYYYVPNALYFFTVCTLFSGARESFLALSAAGHAGGPRIQHGASVGPDRAQWRVLWAFKVAKSGK